MGSRCLRAIIPVPLYHFRQWYRGYNQADLLANWLSSWCHVPNCNHVVKRIKHTHTQRGLTAKDRRQNLKMLCSEYQKIFSL